MADFMEQEAVESDSDGSEDMGRKKRPVGCSSDDFLLIIFYGS